MPVASEPSQFQGIDLGRLPYAEALAVQRQYHQRVLAGAAPMTLLLLEHDPVITVSRRRSAPGHLRASSRQLAQLGIDVQPTDRGGDITYHGPGQLVAWPILKLSRLGMNVGRYVRWLEQVVIDTVAAFGVEAHRDPQHRGVWIAATPPAKLCAVGVRVRRNVTMHGLALNVSTNLAHFRTIVPCGLADRAVTSLEQLLGPAAPAMPQVRDRLVETMREALP